jgi:hypothetical protein
MIQLDYTYEYDTQSHTRVVVILTDEPLDPDEIFNFAFEVNAIDRESDNDQFVIKFLGDTDPRILTEGELYHLWLP